MRSFTLHLMQGQKSGMQWIGALVTWRKLAKLTMKCSIQILRYLAGDKHTRLTWCVSAALKKRFRSPDLLIRWYELMTGNLAEYLLLVFVHNIVCCWRSSMSSDLGLLRCQLKPWGPRKKKQVLKRWNKQRRVQNYGAPVRSVEFQTFFDALWYSDSKAG